MIKRKPHTQKYLYKPYFVPWKKALMFILIESDNRLQDDIYAFNFYSKNSKSLEA